MEQDSRDAETHPVSSLDLKGPSTTMGLNLTTADGALKDDYQPAAREQLNNHFMILNQVEKNTKDTSGRKAVISIHVKRNKGVGARREGATLPTAGNQAHTQENITLKYQYGRIELTGQTLRFMASDKGAFVRAVESETKGIVTDLKRDVNRQCYTPQAGTIATTVGAAGASSVVLVERAGARRIEPGGVYDIVDGTTDAIVSTVEATGVTVSGTTYTFNYTTLSSGGHAAAAGDRIVISGVVPSENAELLGLAEIVDSAGTLHNVDPTTYAVWKSYERAVTSAPSDSLFEEALDEIQQTSGEDPNLLIVSYGARRAYANSLKSQKRFAGDPLELKGGFKATTVTAGSQSVALVAERDCDEDVAYIVNTSHLVEFVASDWEFMDEDGAVLSRVAGKDAYEATLYKYHELATDRRNAHGKITGLVTA